jgi:DNA-binding response OmpR family regulator
MVRDMAVRALRSGGYEVLAAPAAAEALEATARVSGPVHLLVTDVVVPGMNGRRLAEELARRRPGLRVLFVSGYAVETTEGPGQLDRGSNFLPKPFTPSQLLAQVREVLDGA